MSAFLRAACLTPPAIGGIAVIQVAGPGADQVVGRFLWKGKTRLDLSRMPASELRLCRIADGDETIDDAIVCTRTSQAGEPVVDLNLHGGVRIVQRVLLMLQREGVRIAEPAALLDICWPAPTRLHADAYRLMAHVHTRRVARWLARLPDLLGPRIAAILAAIEADRTSDAISGLDGLLAGAGRAELLVSGVRAVLVGQPNSGKSTLANALAEREQAIVSDLPGTTRDWTEHPAAIDGVPVTFVDTAGIRPTSDPIEAEAIRRTSQQISQARILIRVIDGTQPPDRSDEALIRQPSRGAGEQISVLDVYNKADLPVHPANELAVRQPDAIQISARTGLGLERLRGRLLEAVAIGPGADETVAPFTAEQADACRRARDALSRAPITAGEATEWLQNLLRADVSDGSASAARV